MAALALAIVGSVEDDSAPPAGDCSELSASEIACCSCACARSTRVCDSASLYSERCPAVADIWNAARSLCWLASAAVIAASLSDPNTPLWQPLDRGDRALRILAHQRRVRAADPGSLPAHLRRQHVGGRVILGQHLPLQPAGRPGRAAPAAALIAQHDEPD